ncbi:2,3-bisphosphoglycerate-dependent phosphoglycerate mutase [Ignavibacteria bacterium CHB1]|jgi:2,3-bisphosphoglycerate-dependent phosphoglycerate mutase|nr:MAG: 2,3-bisphosphoglycerate-dependent phosphoglycerate mutase [Chlorobiota bacterium]KXK06212.1 MAG: phosphoglycerate mutase 1 family protein [Chlorobi bacterium OLB4]MBV6399275.1 2,3-bisphosphoglycerate-dependent phosphoglycerate mutase [Ignavibacteria bacterium]MCC6884948.1 2,3-bisphosphoglycerate-dependent phosphoglycerate mutase [Ignavibacteriales bacterium]MCE7953521.1 2,3-bisphosphoglycerate-dependent phosphoglycerate mutase [Chlorobi bacterium CHB7]MDL1887589.1 2,3-bisphosphoglycera
MPNLVIVRHGQSKWNLENKFTGWIDIDLSEQGIAEAHNAGEKLKNFKFDLAFTSDLIRAQRTLDIILEDIGQKEIPVEKNIALNERMYGDLQGLNKDDTRKKFGDEQVKIWRRSYDVPPPNGESLKDTADRVLPYYHEKIEPELKKGKDILISAHGNSLRALIMYLEKLTPQQILETEIPTGTPKLYKLDSELNVVETNYI